MSAVLRPRYRLPGRAKRAERLAILVTALLLAAAFVLTGCAASRGTAAASAAAAPVGIR